MSLHRLLVACCTGLVLCGVGQARASDRPWDGPVVSICDDQNEWPPYTYFQRVNGAKSTQIVGYSVDIIKEIFAARGIAFKLTLLPWARCLDEVASGKKYQMALNLVGTAERDKKYWMTNTYYSIRDYYFYSRKHYPQGLPIKSMADLHNYKVCGILNYDHSNMGFKPGEIDQSATSYGMIITKMHLNRCTLFISQYEGMLGFSFIGQSYFDDPDLGYAPVPGFRPASFKMAISRKMAQGEQLRDLVDAELAKMAASGRLASMWLRYLPPAPPPAHR